MRGGKDVGTVENSGSLDNIEEEKEDTFKNPDWLLSLRA
jgi:hypothetical protein